MKKIILWLMLLSCWVGATQNTITGGRWSAASIQATDTVIVTGSVGPDTIDGSFTFVAYRRTAANNQNQIDVASGSKITLTGGGFFWDDSGSATTKAYPDTIFHTTNSGVFRIAATSGSFNPGGCVLSFTAPKDTMTDNKGTTSFRALRASGDSLLLNGSGTTVYLGATTLVTIGANTKLIQNAPTTLRPSGSQQVWTLGSGASFVGTGALTITPYTSSGQTDTLNAISKTGTITISMNTSATIVQGGNLSSGTSVFVIANASAGNSLTYNTNGYNISGGALRTGAGNATATATFIWGSGTHTVASVDQTVYNTGTITDSMKTSKWIVGGSWTYGSNHTVVIGTFKIWTTGTCNFTMAGKSVYDLTDSLGALTFLDAPTIQNDFTISAGNTGGCSWSGYTMTVNGDLFAADGSGTLNPGNGVTIDEPGALIHIGSVEGTVSASNCVLTFNNTGCTLDDDKGMTIKGITLGTKATVTSSGGATSILSAASPMLIFGDSSSLTQTSVISLRPTNSCQVYTMGTGATYTGAGAFTIIPITNNNQVDTLNAFTKSGTGGVTVQQTSTGNTFVLNGNFSVPSAIFRILNGQSSSNMTFLMGSNNLVCGQFRHGATSGTGNLFISFGSGTHHIGGWLGATDTTGTSYDSLKSCRINCSGSWTGHPKNNIIPGTATVCLDSTGTLTTAGDRFAFFIDSTASNQEVTLGDSLTCDSAFYIKKGKFNQNSKVIYTRDYSNTSPDTVKMSANLNISRNYTRGSPTIVSRTGGSMIFDTTNVPHTATLNNNAIGPLVTRNMTFSDSGSLQKLTISDSGTITYKNGSGLRIDTLARNGGSSGKVVRWLSSVAGSAARVWTKAYTATYMYFKDIASSEATITASDPSNTDGTGNSGIDFGGPTDTVPIITAISPTTSCPSGGDSATITLSVAGGQNIDTVYFGDTATALINGNRVKIPAHPSDTVNIIVANGAGRDTLPDAFVYFAAPTIIYDPLTLTRATAFADTPATLTGAVDSIISLAPLPDGITLDSTTGVLSGTPTALLFPPQIYTVRAYGCSDSGDAIISLQINDRVPIITSVTRAYGKPTGGDTVTIRGTWLKYVDTVWFGAEFTTDTASMTDSLIKAVVPAHGPGVVDVIVRNSAGTDTLTNGYEYNALYGIDHTPKNFAGDTAGGDTIRFTAAYGLTGATMIWGEAVPPVVTVDGDTTAYIVTPAGARGRLSVTLLASGVAYPFTWQYGKNNKQRRFRWGWGWGF